MPGISAIFAASPARLVARDVSVGFRSLREQAAKSARRLVAEAKRRMRWLMEAPVVDRARARRQEQTHSRAERRARDRTRGVPRLARALRPARSGVELRLRGRHRVRCDETRPRATAVRALLSGHLLAAQRAAWPDQRARAQH